MRAITSGILSVALIIGLGGCVAEPPAEAAPTTIPLAAWTRALAERDTRSATWVAVGDSITEGQGASSRSTRWIDLTRASLRKYYSVAGVPGGVGYLPAQFAVYEPDSPWANWSTAATGDTRLSLKKPALGYRTVEMSPGSTRTYPFVGTDLDLWWTRGGGRFSYSIDAGPAVSVDTSGSRSVAHITKISGLPDGAHTVTLAATGQVTLEGLAAYRGDRSTGIITYDSAQSGATVDTYLADLPQFLRTLKVASPDLVSISLGGNDAGTEKPAALERKYFTLVSAIRKLPSRPSVLLIGEFIPGPAMTMKFQAPFSQYLSAIHRVAKRTGSDYIDLNVWLPPADTSGTGYYSTDGLHPSDPGQRKIASIMMEIIG